MNARCPGSMMQVTPNADGRGRCPYCEDDWHCLTKDQRIKPHGPNKRARAWMKRVHGVMKPWWLDKR